MNCIITALALNWCAATFSFGSHISIHSVVALFYFAPSLFLSSTYCSFLRSIFLLSCFTDITSVALRKLSPQTKLDLIAQNSLSRLSFLSPFLSLTWVLPFCRYGTKKLWNKMKRESYKSTQQHVWQRYESKMNFVQWCFILLQKNLISIYWLSALIVYFWKQEQLINKNIDHHL